MLPKENRVKKKKDFDAIFKKASHSLDNKIFVLKVAKNKIGQKRFGFIVSQKVSKKATVRNKIRRRLSEVVNAEFGNIKDGVDVVIIARPSIENKNFSDIKKSVKDGLLKVGLIK